MAKNHVLPCRLFRATVCLCVLLGSSILAKVVRVFPADTRESVHSSFGIDLPAPVDVELKSTTDHRQELRAIYMAEIGVREATGRNDGERIAAYLQYCNLGPGHAWCAAFVSWSFGQLGFSQPRNPWSPALFPEKRIVWKQASGAAKAAEGPGGIITNTRTATPSQPKPGDVFGIYYSSIRRIGHVGFVDAWGNNQCITVEGNTGPEGAMPSINDPANPIRAGPDTEGVFRKRRPIRTIYAVADWISSVNK